MRLAVHRGNGQADGTPDVCNTPSASGTTPVAYVNNAQTPQAVAFSNLVLICSQNALHLASTVPQTSGDEAGTAHAVIKGKQAFTTGNATVLIEGQPGIAMGDPTTHNAGNCPTGTVTQPSASTVFYSRRLGLRAPVADDPRRVPIVDEHRLDRAALLAMARELSSPALRGAGGRRKVRHFGRSLLPALAAAIGRDPAAPLGLDLRGVAGGRVDVALAAAGLFLGAGAELSLTDAEGRRATLTTAGTRRHHGPVALWTDGETASAAELFASLLVRAARATPVDGPLRGYGKRAIQRLDLDPAGATLRTVATWSVR